MYKGWVFQPQFFNRYLFHSFSGFKLSDAKLTAEIPFIHTTHIFNNSIILIKNNLIFEFNNFKYFFTFYILYNVIMIL